jgi:hypothetical protein
MDVTEEEIQAKIYAIVREQLTESWNDGFRTAVRQMKAGFTVEDMVGLAVSLKDGEKEIIK